MEARLLVAGRGQQRAQLLQELGDGGRAVRGVHRRQRAAHALRDGGRAVGRRAARGRHDGQQADAEGQALRVQLGDQRADVQGRGRGGVECEDGIQDVAPHLGQAACGSGKRSGRTQTGGSGERLACRASQAALQSRLVTDCLANAQQRTPKHGLEQRVQPLWPGLVAGVALQVVHLYSWSMAKDRVDHT